MAENTRPVRRRRGPGVPGEKAKDFKGTIKALLKYMGRYKIAVAAIMVFAAVSTVFNVIGPKILGEATTELFNGLIAKLTGAGGIDFGKIGSILLMLMGLYGLCALLSFLQGLLMTEVSQRMTYRLRQDISTKINRMPLAYFEDNAVGDILSRVTNDVDMLGHSFNQSITETER